MPNLLESARAAQAAGRLDEAEQLCNELLASDPRNAEAHLLLGIVATNRNQGDDAVQRFRQVLAIEPDNFDALNWLAVLLWQAGKIDEAAGLCRRAIELRPDALEGHNNLGLCFQSQGRFAEAEGCYRRAAEIRPDLAAIHHNLGWVLQNLGRDAEAAASFRRATELAPEAAGSHLALAETLLRLRDQPRALASARRSVQLAPNMAAAHLVLAQVLSETELALAEQEVRLAIELDPSMFLAHSLLGYLLQAKGDFEGAKLSLLRSVELQPRQGGSYYGLVQGRMTRDDVPLLAKMGSLLRQNIAPIDRIVVNYALGKAMNDLGEYRRAIQHYDEANALAKRLFQAHWPFDRDRYVATVDRTIEMYSKPLLERFHELGSDSERPIFVIGMMRSGTTLVEQIVSSHPDVYAGGELRFWLQQGQTVFDPADEASLSGLQQSYLGVLADLDQAAPRVTDKMPQNYQMLGLIHLAFPKARILHVQRDPVDTCLSIYTTPYTIPPEFAYDQANIAFAYRQYQRLMAHWQDVLPADAFLEVRYEELAADPEPAIRQILAYLGLPWDDACLHHDRNARMVGTPSLWQVRQPVYTSSVQKWKKYEPWIPDLIAGLGA